MLALVDMATAPAAVRSPYENLGGVITSPAECTTWSSPPASTVSFREGRRTMLCGHRRWDGQRPGRLRKACRVLSWRSRAEPAGARIGSTALPEVPISPLYGTDGGTGAAGGLGEPRRIMTPVHRTVSAGIEPHRLLWSRHGCRIVAPLVGRQQLGWVGEPRWCADRCTRMRELVAHRLDCFVKGTNAALYHKWWNGSSWNAGYEYLRRHHPGNTELHDLVFQSYRLLCTRYGPGTLAPLVERRLLGRLGKPRRQTVQSARMRQLGSEPHRLLRSWDLGPASSSGPGMGSSGSIGRTSAGRSPVGPNA